MYEWYKTEFLHLLWHLFHCNVTARSNEKSDNMSRSPLHVFKCQSVTLPEINITEFLWLWFCACQSSRSFSVAICLSLRLKVACCLLSERLGFVGWGFMIFFSIAEWSWRSLSHPSTSSRLVKANATLSYSNLEPSVKPATFWPLILLSNLQYKNLDL